MNNEIYTASSINSRQSLPSTLVRTRKYIITEEPLNSNCKFGPASLELTKQISTDSTKTSFKPENARVYKEAHSCIYKTDASGNAQINELRKLKSHHYIEVLWWLDK